MLVYLVIVPSSFGAIPSKKDVTGPNQAVIVPHHYMKRLLVCPYLCCLGFWFICIFYTYVCLEMILPCFILIQLLACLYSNRELHLLHLDFY